MQDKNMRGTWNREVKARRSKSCKRRNSADCRVTQCYRCNRIKDVREKAICSSNVQLSITGSEYLHHHIAALTKRETAVSSRVNALAQQRPTKANKG